MISRRKLLGLGALSLASAAAINTSSFTTNIIKLEEKTFKLKNLPRSFENYRIGFLSDIHFGPFVPSSWVEEAISILNKKSIDILVLGGDYVNIPESGMSKMLGKIRNKEANTLLKKMDFHSLYISLLRVFKTAKTKDGVVAVHGNHDKWLAPFACEKVFKENNVNFLINEELIIKRGSDELFFSGVDDMMG